MFNPLVMLDALIIVVMALLALGFLDEDDAVKVYIFCFISLTYNTIGDLFPESGSIYYVGAGLADLLTIYILSKFIHVSEVTLKIQRICIAFIAVNACGWVLFMLYEPPLIYKVLCSVLYLYTLSTVAISGVKHVLGNGAMDSGSYGFYGYDSISHNDLHSNKSEAKN